MGHGLTKATILALAAVVGASSRARRWLPMTPVPLEVALGDVSINKVPFLIAADAGLYAKNGLDVEQFITPFAADAIRRSGVVVPPAIRQGRCEDKVEPIEITGGHADDLL